MFRGVFGGGPSGDRGGVHRGLKLDLWGFLGWFHGGLKDSEGQSKRGIRGSVRRGF